MILFCRRSRHISQDFPLGLWDSFSHPETTEKIEEKIEKHHKQKKNMGDKLSP